MRYSLFFLGLLLSCTLARAQVVFENPGDGRPELNNISYCISLLEFDLPTSYDEQLLGIIQTGRPYGVQSGYSHIINRDPGCMPDGDLVITFSKTGECESMMDINFSVTYLVDIIFNDQIVERRVLNGIGYEEIIVPISNLGLEEITVVPAIVSLELRVSTETSVMGSGVPNYDTQHLADVMIVGEGTELYFQHERNDGEQVRKICNRVALGDLDDVLQNCSTSEEINLDFQMSNFTSNSSTNTFAAAYNVTASVGYTTGNPDYQVQGSWQYGGALSGEVGQSIEIQDQEILSNAATFTLPIVLPPRSETGCSFLGLDFIGKTVYIQSYRVDCERLSPQEITNEQIQYYAARPTVCTEPGDITMECVPVLLRHQKRIKPRDIIAEDNDRFSDDDCVLAVSTSQTPEPEYAQTFVWEGPNGYTAVGENVDNLPIGIYTLTIYDECGGETEYTIDPCEGGATISPWSFNTDANQFCRTISCDGGEECEDFTYEECVIPEFGDWVYDDLTGTACRSLTCPEGGTCDVTEQCVPVTYGVWDYFESGQETICQRDVLVNGEVIQQEENQASLSYDFDPITEQCLEFVRCGGPRDIILDLVGTEREEPLYEEWSFDEFTEVCVRLVRCFDLSPLDIETDPDLDFENPANTNWEDTNEEPQYEWEYDDGWGCVGYVFCDPFEQPIHPSNTDWELDFGQGEPIFTSIDYQDDFGVISCILDVDCEFNGQAYDTAPSFPPVTSDPIDPFTATFIGTPANGYCEYAFQCGDLPPITVDRVFIGLQTGINTNGEPLCKVFCEGFQATTTHPEEVLCSSLPNYITSDNKLVAGEELQEVIQKELRAKVGAEAQVDMQVMPNPFNKQLILRSLPKQDVRIVLLNVEGQVVLEQMNDQLPSTTLHTDQLPNGIYLLMILGNNEELLYERRLLKVD
ncbi:MAG: T9SS type A sorting domain-containing protein [Bacteroidota bacterium]